MFNAYCLDKDNGLGIAQPVALNVFQPFFVSVNLPYSVVKGEEFPVVASVFTIKTFIFFDLSETNLEINE